MNIDLGTFSTGQTPNNPAYIFDQARDSWNAYFDNVITLIEFVKQKLKDDLYYQLIYNVLTTEEKYFIGLYCDTNNSEQAKALTECTFNFRKYYNTNIHKYHLATDTYCPIIEITNSYVRKALTRQQLEFEDDNFLISYEKGFDHFNLETKIINIDLEVYYYETVHVKCTLLRKQFQPNEVKQSKYGDFGITFNFSDDVNRTVRNHTKSTNINTSINFEIEYSGHQYIIQSYRVLQYGGTHLNTYSF